MNKMLLKLLRPFLKLEKVNLLSIFFFMTPILCNGQTIDDEMFSEKYHFNDLEFARYYAKPTYQNQKVLIEYNHFKIAQEDTDGNLMFLEVKYIERNLFMVRLSKENRDKFNAKPYITVQSWDTPFEKALSHRVLELGVENGEYPYCEFYFAGPLTEEVEIYSILYISVENVNYELEWQLLK